MKNLWRMGGILLLSILGLVATTQAQQQQQQQQSEPSELPENFPPIQVEISEGAFPGNLYFGIYAEEGVESPYGDFVVTMDAAGEVIFQRETLPMRAYNFYPYPIGWTAYYQQSEAAIGGRGGFGMKGYVQFLDAQGTPFRQVNLPAEYEDRMGAHDYILLENENIIVIAHEVREMDMTAYGGVPNAIVVTTSLLELDPEGNTVWYWSGWDNLPIEHCVFPDMLKRAPPQPVAYAHINGLTLSPDGTAIIASVRHFDQVIKIDRATGEILWRMGGQAAVANDFTFIDDPYEGTSHQHHPTFTADNRLLLFDNGNNRDPRFSRVVEYELDEESLTATLIWEYAESGIRFAERQGSAQRLLNGNTLIGWGIAAADGGPAIEEVTPDRVPVMRVFFPQDFITYRAYKLQLVEAY
jgi:hypothetical protein